ncbi:MAG: gamma-glutamyl-gamma-aminobutyrate hydrolase family protein [Christensenellales bacterium]|jgi:putative glutamine amidotransferase
MNETKPLIGVTPYAKKETGERYVPEGYLKGIVDSGGTPHMIDYANFPLGALPQLADELDALVLSGGADVDPAYYGETDWPEAEKHIEKRDKLEIELFKLMFARKKPILGICRGQQVINVAMGGSLVQHVPKVYGTVHQQDADDQLHFWHDVEITPGSLVARVFGVETLLTNSYHHQSVACVADGLIVTARARDGVIEAMEYAGDQFVLCLQWHPEKTIGIDEYSIKPFEALRAAIRR